MLTEVLSGIWAAVNNTKGLHFGTMPCSFFEETTNLEHCSIIKAAILQGFVTSLRESFGRIQAIYVEKIHYVNDDAAVLKTCLEFHLHKSG